MPKWTQNEYEEWKRRTFIANHREGAASVLELDSSYEPLGTCEEKETVGERVLVRITSVRKRLTDTDNCCCKFLVDTLRYCGALESDAFDKTKIEVQQRKCGPKEREHTEITIWKP